MDKEMEKAILAVRVLTTALEDVSDMVGKINTQDEIIISIGKRAAKGLEDAGKELK
jgi:hypothetical protein